MVARVQLRRALQSWDTWSAGVPEELPADEHTSTQDDRGKSVTIRRRPDLWGIIDRCLGRVGRLVEQRAPCVLVVVGATQDGHRELLAIGRLRFRKRDGAVTATRAGGYDLT
jgi:hypothetical protein